MNERYFVLNERLPSYQKYATIMEYYQ